MFLGYKYVHLRVIRVFEKYEEMLDKAKILVFVKNCEYKDDWKFWVKFYFSFLCETKFHDDV
jgi:hypothetical protein